MNVTPVFIMLSTKELIIGKVASELINKPIVNLEVKDPMIVNTLMGVVVLVDYIPYLTVDGSSIVNFNPGNIIYIEPVGTKMYELYERCVQQRDYYTIGDTDDLINSTNKILAKVEEKYDKNVASNTEVSNTVMSVDDPKVVDMKKILDALKKKETLN